MQSVTRRPRRPTRPRTRVHVACCSLITSRRCNSRTGHVACFRMSLGDHRECFRIGQRNLARERNNVFLGGPRRGCASVPCRGIPYLLGSLIKSAWNTTWTETHNQAGGWQLLPAIIEVVALGLQLGNVYQDFIRRVHPIHRNRITMFRRTTDARGPILAAAYLDFTPSDRFAANEAITFFIKGAPQPELIESLQDVQFFFIGQFDRRSEFHGQSVLFHQLSRNPAIAGLEHQSKS